ncbi:MAG: 2,3-bisphosphoglycerate-independent phosphoglycerate mutase [Proteobacteria bacterium]|nr:2,3-bisphosphoglycerate-independent phosphoglycerate mutase [Pseudomonadota bacterium]
MNHCQPTHLLKQPLLCVIADGVGLSAETFGNAVQLARTPNMDYLKQYHPHGTLFAHGPHVGLASEHDVGNSEVGHNTLGAGQIYDQGAKSVDQAISSGKAFVSPTWLQLIAHIKQHGSTLHFLGLLSDGNVHSHEKHLHILMAKACEEEVQNIRLHLLFDGRDVAARSAEQYVARLNKVIRKLITQYQVNIQIASGGGRMHMTMDRYEADWPMVARGWDHHVLGRGQRYSQLTDYFAHINKQMPATDQHLEGFVIADESGPVGAIEDGDGVLCFNFRADRVIQISKAFCQTNDFSYFTRHRVPKVFYVGLTCYDGDLLIPKNFLVQGPAIKNPLSQLLVSQGIHQWACSETQKFGHVTFFWNGNTSGYFNPDLELYHNIPSLSGCPSNTPKMQAEAITEATVRVLHQGNYDFYRINFPNGDMVGHTGNLTATIQAVECVDNMIGRLMTACRETGTCLLITADHGNCELMAKKVLGEGRESVVQITTHTTNPVPLYLYNSFLLMDHMSSGTLPLTITHHQREGHGLANIAATILDLMGLPVYEHYLPSILSNIGQHKL